MGGQQDVPALFQPQPGVNVAGLDLRKVLMQHLGHGRARHIGALPGQTAVGQIPPRVLGIRHVHIRDNVHDAAVRFLRQALVLAAIARLHMKDRDVQPLRADDGKTAVRIAQHQHGIRLDGDRQLVALRNDIAHRFAEIRAHRVHVHLRIVQFQIAEEHAVEIVVVVLTSVRQNRIEILPAFCDNCRQSNDLRACTDDDQQLQFAIIFKGYITIISHCLSPLTPAQRRYPDGSD